MAVEEPAVGPAGGALAGDGVGLPTPDAGRVYLVGAGPGDPGLLTVRGRALLERADVVVYDRLVDAALLALCPPSCERIYAGKAPGRAVLSQAEINRALITRAAAGKAVVRLKGGDPFVFGRGGEEALALAATGLPFEIVPGVSSAVAVPAYAGIPVTFRESASSFAVVTGHERPGRATPAVDWSAYGKMPQTLVVLMGLAELEAISAALIAAGRSPGLPAAVISAGTTARQRTVVSDLAGIAAAAADLPSPALLVIGEVVGLRAQLRWFENRPLFGRRVLITRTRAASSEIAELLRLLGAEPVELPVLRIRPSPDRAGLLWAARNINSYWWLCFTSANAVRPLFEALVAEGRDARTLAGTRVACVGPATAKAIAAFGVTADCVPERATAADLIEVMRPQVTAGQRALFVRGDPASDTLATGLEHLGLSVRQVVAYEAVPDTDAAARAAALLSGDEAAAGLDAVTFASSASIGHFIQAAGDAGRELCRRSKVVCIGPLTAQAAASWDLRVDAVAPEASAEGMLRALLGLWSASTKSAGE